MISRIVLGVLILFSSSVSMADSVVNCTTGRLPVTNKTIDKTYSGSQDFNMYELVGFPSKLGAYVNTVTIDISSDFPVTAKLIVDGSVYDQKTTIGQHRKITLQSPLCVQEEDSRDSDVDFMDNLFFSALAGSYTINSIQVDSYLSANSLH